LLVIGWCHVHGIWFVLFQSSPFLRNYRRITRAILLWQR
jgi:hypothetical protein